MDTYHRVLTTIRLSLLGIATNLYSDDFRNAITMSGRTISPATYSILFATVAASGSTAVVYRLLLLRRLQRSRILEASIRIGSDALSESSNERDVVVGRALHYLECKHDSDELVIFLHGLGLDANDFRSYLAESKLHCIALTLYGFNTAEKYDEHYKPISLQSHVRLLAY